MLLFLVKVSSNEYHRLIQYVLSIDWVFSVSRFLVFAYLKVVVPGEPPVAVLFRHVGEESRRRASINVSVAILALTFTFTLNVIAFRIHGLHLSGLSLHLVQFVVCVGDSKKFCFLIINNYVTSF